MPPGATLNQSGHLLPPSTSAHSLRKPQRLQSQTINLGGLTSMGNAAKTLRGCSARSRSRRPTRQHLCLASVDPPGSDPRDVMFIRSTNGGAVEQPIRITTIAAGQNSYQWFGASQWLQRTHRRDLERYRRYSTITFPVLKYAYRRITV